MVERPPRALRTERSEGPMDLSAFEAVQELRQFRTLLGYDDVGGPDRTLMLGYLVDRNSVHLYLRGSAIHRVVSDWRGQVKSHLAKQWWTTEELLEGQKRWYPERCDQDFCVLVGQAKGWIEFTTFDDGTRELTEEQLFLGEMCGCQMWRGRH